MSSNTGYRRLLRRLLSAILLLLAACTVDTVDTGGSSGTEISKVTGTATDPGGNPVADATVRLRPMCFLAGSGDSADSPADQSIIDTVTGADGSFTLAGLAVATYLLEVTYGDTLGCCIKVSIDSPGTGASLPAAVLEPLAEITGHIEMECTYGIAVTVKAYGLDRSVPVTPTGDFALKIPGGKHRIHIGAILDTQEVAGEYYGFDMPPIDVRPGERQYAGSLIFRPPPPAPCTGGTCDSSVVRTILEAIGGNAAVWPDSITETDSGRIVALNLRGRDLSDGICYEVNRLSALRLLDLGNTGLPRMFHDIGNLARLETVRLDGNAIGYFAIGAGNLAHLRELDLHDNGLSSLHPSLLLCEQLEHLDVAGNRLCSIEPAMSTWLDNIAPDWRTTQRCR